LNFESVTLWDVHSDVALALLNNVTNVEPEYFLGSILSGGKKDKYVLVSPDAGAMKKVAKIAKIFNCPMITASKIRNPQNGEITGTEIHIPNEFIGRKFLIVDDLIDGGRTFIELAKAIRTANNGEATSIDLYVTHGIFSKGIDVLHDAGICNIYTANPFPTVDLTNPYLIVVK
jgi:ribose-phosphate pyrophosphokinase